MAEKLKLSGKVEDAKAQLEGRLLAGPEGKPLVIEDVRVGEDIKTGTPQVELVAEVSSLKAKFGDDWEPVETQRLSALMTFRPGQSNEMSLDVLSRALGLAGDDRLKDDGEDWFRLVADDHPQTLVPKLKGVALPSLYFTAKVTPDATGNVKAVYFNLASPAVRKSGSKLDELRKRFGKPKDAGSSAF